MFIKSINDNIKSIKPLLTGRLQYNNFEIINGISTLIVLNNEGDILTCGHIADLFIMADEINEVFFPILKELQNKNKKEIKKIEDKYGIKHDTIVGIHNILVDIADNPGKLNIIKHPLLDIAIIRLKNKDNVLIKDYPSFRNNNPLIGEHICKLGFAFPEYSTFYYDNEECQIKTNNKIMNFPLFPTEGMVTRNIADVANEITMFEISTPCLPGQSGGPVLDKEGAICGIQIGTKRISGAYNNEMSFNLDLGIAINVSTILSFLDKHQIKYNKVSK